MASLFNIDQLPEPRKISRREV